MYNMGEREYILYKDIFIQFPIFLVNIMSNQKETYFQNKILKPEIERRFQGCHIHKMEGEQGMPDLLILYNKHWALLEAKRGENSEHQPNQDYWVDQFNQLSFL